MTDEREKRLAELVLELAASRAERKAILRELVERDRALLDELNRLAQDIRSGQLTIDGGPQVTVVGVTNGRR